MLKANETLSLESRLWRSLLQCKAIQLDLEEALETIQQLKRERENDRLVADHDLVDLDAKGVESFISRKRIWKLNVQGVVLELTMPSILVRDALVKAGFNPDQGWHIFLKVAGQKKQPVELTTEIDLRTPGIEKIRLTPKDVNNGEASHAPRRRDHCLFVLSTLATSTWSNPTCSKPASLAIRTRLPWKESASKSPRSK